MVNNRNKNKVRITIGDWSPGGSSDDFVFISNKSANKIQKAYKNSCELTGIQFNNNENYTKIHWKLSHYVCVEYADQYLSEDVVKILDDHGIYSLGSDEILRPKDLVELIVAFIGLSLPGLKLKPSKFKRSYFENIPPINGWNCDEFPHILGYGLYGSY